MASSVSVRLASACMALLLAVFAASLPALAQTQDQRVTICQRTGSVSTPWVFTTIDAGDLPEHQARGDFRAESIAECPRADPAMTATPVPAAPRANVTPPAATLTPLPTAAPTRPAAQQAGILGGLVPDIPVAQLLAPTGTPVSTATTATPVSTRTAAQTSTSTPQPTVSVAGVQAAPQPPVSTLPPSGGEPDLTPMVLFLVGIGGVGLGLLRVARVRG